MTPVVWKLDRLSRSLKDLLILLENIQLSGASLTESIDTSTPAGRMMMQMVGAFAEFEREMLRAAKGNRLSGDIREENQSGCG